MRNLGGSIIFLAVMLLADIYIFQALKTISGGANLRTKWLVYGTYWAFCAAGFVFFAMLPYIQFDQLQKNFRIYFMAIVIGFFLAQIVALPFLLIDDLRRLIQYLIAIFVSRNTDAAPGHEASEAISRSIFLSWLGIGMGGALFGTLLYGFRNKYRYEVRRVKLAYEHLPKAFKGLRIVHISDIHSGSFTDPDSVARGVDLINKQHADLILFTGDLVNDRAVEMEPYTEIFSKVSAPMGVFSTLGNHDYGDYIAWPDRDETHAAREKEAGTRIFSPMQAKNLDDLKQVHANMGWRLLMDEHVILEKDGDKIALIGVQNISGRGRFHSYGDLKKAYQAAAHLPFKILLSHDPSHWDAEVRPHYPDIDLMLSGHTHGMQFGVELPGFKWSPVKWVYRQWADLYEHGMQRLYVNRGFGFIGYPGRVGILPEITVIELA